jgi:pSer/pThr/pTyr-binding forkhead associated (FHA) protein
MPRVIITVQNKNPQPYRFQLDRKVVSLGRGSDNDIVIDSGSVSGKHAEMHRVEGGYELADLGSTNGIKYAETRQQVIQLRSGMSVKLGDVAFDFNLSEEELELLGREKPAQESPVIMEEEISPPENPKKHRPAAQPGKSRKPERTADTGSFAASFLMILLFLVLASGAFYAGLDIRHRKETGEWLLKGIVNKSDALEVAPDPAPVEDKVAE